MMSLFFLLFGEVIELCIKKRKSNKIGLLKKKLCKEKVFGFNKVFRTNVTDKDIKLVSTFGELHMKIVTSIEQ